MTIFKETIDEEYLTISEAKELLEEVEMERAMQDEREVTYELARAIEHANQFAVLEANEAQELVAELQELEKVDEKTAYKIADLLPETRDELRTIYAKDRYTLTGDELDEILNIVAKYV